MMTDFHKKYLENLDLILIKSMYIEIQLKIYLKTNIIKILNVLFMPEE